MDPQKIETTYAELRDGDILIDKSGGRWHVSGTERTPSQGLGFHVVTFWLGDVRTKVRVHHMTKSAGDPVTVERIATHADDVAALEADFQSMHGRAMRDSERSALPDPFRPPATSSEPGAGDDPWQTERLEAEAHDAAVAEVVKQVGAVVEVDVTAAEVDAARQSTEDEPVVLPLFESMTDLEQRSHCFVLHGVFLEDVEDRIERSKLHAAMHRDAAQGKLKSRHTPHEHSEKVSA